MPQLQTTGQSNATRGNILENRQKQIFYLLPLPWGQGHTKCSSVPLHYMTNASVKFAVAMSND